MTVNHPGSLFLHLCWNAIDMPIVEEPTRVSANWVYMSLQGVPFWGSPLNAQIAPTSGHPCLMQGNSCDM